ncbi:MAG: S-adenosylmethionine:tRNA ribosyltransferase-isomerase, partial [Phaeodactylibacter sp.]|nr:S-adenosylmethionine:tRNA ribosyltransferase-isomerase [Phaeodactylibacter sp.]
MPAQDERRSPRAIRIEDYDYGLPEERIAQFPLEQRDASKLLLYRGGQISHTHFRKIAGYLPEGALLVFNDTKVIHARLHFSLPNGSPLEILCLEPLAPAEYQQNFSSSSPVRWRCLVGGNRKWKSGAIEKMIDNDGGKEICLRATRRGRSASAFDILFEWDQPQLAFGELLAQAGILPLPPYLNRKNVPSDEDRYQTVYAREQGSVAAPTAGLHFT